jgi:hypothetical protein
MRPDQLVETLRRETVREVPSASFNMTMNWSPPKLTLHPQHPEILKKYATHGKMATASTVKLANLLILRRKHKFVVSGEREDAPKVICVYFCIVPTNLRLPLLRPPRPPHSRR